MKAIKFRYRLTDKSILSDEWFFIIIGIERLENGFFAEIYPSRTYAILSKDQYTGFKDKNEKEIYTGDIIKTDGIFEVIWHSGGFCMIRRLPHKPTDLSQVEWYLPYSIGNKGYEKEVIGNIYQNPELVEGENEAGEHLADKV